MSVTLNGALSNPSSSGGGVTIDDTLNVAQVGSGGVEYSDEDCVPTMDGETTDGCTITGTANDSGEYYAPWKACDDGTVGAPFSQVLFSGGAPSEGAPKWMQWEFTVPKTIGKYNLIAGDYARPYTWKFQGSNDGSAWTDLDVVTNGVTSAVDPAEWLVDTPASYTFYRFYCTAWHASVSYLSIREMELFEVV